MSTKQKPIDLPNISRSIQSAHDRRSTELIADLGDHLLHRGRFKAFLLALLLPEGLRRRLDAQMATTGAIRAMERKEGGRDDG